MTTGPVPGMTYPTQKAMLAGNPRDSAIQASINTNQKLTNLGKIGGRKRGGKKRGGGVIPVPQMQLLYTPQGGNSTNPNAQIQQNAQIGTQGAANRVFDKLALAKGGSRKSRRKTKRVKKSRTNRRKSRKH
jgi:hypothetical protein